jgi:D-serine dehydratase
LPLADFGSQGWNLLREDLPLPVAVLKKSALDRNSRWMRAFLAATGVVLSPHGKTTMSPELHRRQLEEGAWGITLATMTQVRIALRHGVRRILLANQIVGKAHLEFIVDALNRDDTLDFYCLVDSAEGVTALAETAHRQKSNRPVQVLLEMGVPRGRTGCRTLAAGLEVARSVARAQPQVILRGIEGFEGLVPGDTPEDRLHAAHALLDDLVRAAEMCDSEGLFHQAPIILSAGGSAYFDVVAARLAAVKLSRPTLVVLRSGCYLTSDDGIYRTAAAQILERSTLVRQISDTPLPAIEVWSYVQSRPEPDRVVLTMGRRDVSFDAGLPIPKYWHRPGADSLVQALGDGHAIVGLHDQHAVVEVPASSSLRYGDLVGCGISHPCTTFDKWRWLPIVDDRYDVVDAVSTWF